MYSKAVAFVLGLISFVPPFNGLLRFYLKRWGAGTLYTMTAGFCFIGNILDIVQIPRLVDEANRKWKRRELAKLNEIDQLMLGSDSRAVRERPVDRSAASEIRPNLEKIILASASKNNGYTTPSQVALESNLARAAGHARSNPLEHPVDGIRKLVFAQLGKCATRIHDR